MEHDGRRWSSRADAAHVRECTRSNRGGFGGGESRQGGDLRKRARRFVHLERFTPRPAHLSRNDLDSLARALAFEPRPEIALSTPSLRDQVDEIRVDLENLRLAGRRGGAPRSCGTAMGSLRGHEDAYVDNRTEQTREHSPRESQLDSWSLLSAVALRELVASRATLPLSHHSRRALDECLKWRENRPESPSAQVLVIDSVAPPPPPPPPRVSGSVRALLQSRSPIDRGCVRLGERRGERGSKSTQAVETHRGTDSLELRTGACRLRGSASAPSLFRRPVDDCSGSCCSLAGQAKREEARTRMTRSSRGSPASSRALEVSAVGRRPLEQCA